MLQNVLEIVNQDGTPWTDPNVKVDSRSHKLITTDGSLSPNITYFPIR